MSIEVDTIVVGAGVVGLACARAMARAGREVVILEQHSDFGTETSSRNSEVIHAGIYYPFGSQKGKLCVEGKELLYRFCDDYGVGYHRCGKLIVATTTEEESALHGIQVNAARNGVTDLRMLSCRDANVMEPELRCTAALFSPSTGILDSHAFMLALLGDAERFGAQLVLKTPVQRIISANSMFIVHTGGIHPTRIKARHLINAAGLAAIDVARRIEGLDQSHVPQQFMAKGNYFSLVGKAPFSRLVYPIPGQGGLGIHFTLDMGGQGRFGPDVEWIEEIDYSVNSRLREDFYPAIRRYWPKLKLDSLTPAYSGIRPKLSGPGEAAADFLVQGPSTHKISGLVNFFGIESPGLTSSLALADHCLSLVQLNT
jgi:L-2-hydroxyglutarate oxidase LhgO